MWCDGRVMPWPVLVLGVAAAEPLWSEPLSHRDEVQTLGQPTLSELRDSYDELRSAMMLWRRERREHLEEQELEQQRVLRRRLDELPLSPSGLKKLKVEATKGSRTKSRAKVIELSHRAPLDGQLIELQAEAEEHRAACKEDPERCARERQLRRDLERGAELWEEAAEANFEKRRASIDAEALKFQRTLDEARLREARKQAERLGGTVDAQGNFVDADLQEAPAGRQK
jgi:hypothetical protein